MRHRKESQKNIHAYRCQEPGQAARAWEKNAKLASVIKEYRVTTQSETQPHNQEHTQGDTQPHGQECVQGNTQPHGQECVQGTRRRNSVVSEVSLLCRKSLPGHTHQGMYHIP